MAQRHTPDRKVRVKGNRVIHTTRGSVYHGDVGERPRGLTTEQANEERTGTKLAARQSREAAQRAVESGKKKVSSRTTDEVTSTRKR